MEDSNETALTGCVQKDLVDFVECIFDLGMNKNYVSLILDFLIAVHPTTNLYLPHLKTSVYFVLYPQSRIYASPDYYIHISSGIYFGLLYIVNDLYYYLMYLFIYF